MIDIPPTPAPGAMTADENARRIARENMKPMSAEERAVWEEREKRMYAYSRECVEKAGFTVGDGPLDAAPIVIGPPPEPPTYTPGSPQPAVIGGAKQLWQSNLAECWPYVRANGLPGESEILPGRNAPLNAWERDYFAQMLDKGAA